MSNTASHIAADVRETATPVGAQVFYPNVARAALNYAGYITGPKYAPIFGTLTTRVEAALRSGSFDAPARLHEMNPILGSMQKSTIHAAQDAARNALRHRDGWDENRVNTVLPLIGEELQDTSHSDALTIIQGWYDAAMNNTKMQDFIRDTMTQGQDALARIITISRAATWQRLIKDGHVPDVLNVFDQITEDNATAHTVGQAMRDLEKHEAGFIVLQNIDTAVTKAHTETLAYLKRFDY